MPDSERVVHAPGPEQQRLRRHVQLEARERAKPQDHELDPEAERIAARPQHRLELRECQHQPEQHRHVERPPDRPERARAPPPRPSRRSRRRRPTTPRPPRAHLRRPRSRSAACTPGSASAADRPMSAAPARKIAAMRRNSNDSPAWRKNTASDGRNRTRRPRHFDERRQPERERHAPVERLGPRPQQDENREPRRRRAPPRAAPAHALSGRSVMAAARLASAASVAFASAAPG